MGQGGCRSSTSIAFLWSKLEENAERAALPGWISSLWSLPEIPRNTSHWTELIPWLHLVVMWAGTCILLFSSWEEGGGATMCPVRNRISLKKKAGKNEYRDRPLAIFATTVQLGNMLILWDIFEWFCLTAGSTDQWTKIGIHLLSWFSSLCAH